MLSLLEFLFTVIVAIAAAYWAFVKWTGEREKDREDRERERERELAERESEREKERKRLAALYVNPFLLACQELQSRLYNILDRKGLQVLKERYPDASYAEETLYYIAEYFGWQWSIYRYSPYAQDRRIIQITEAIRDIFATDAIRPGPFCFFRLEQRNLGQLVMKRAAGEVGGEFNVIPYHEFQHKLKESGLAAHPSFDSTLAALRDANGIEDIEVPARQRLARVQNHLVELLAYLEEKEGISLFFSDRHKKRLKAKIPRTKR